MEALVNFLRDNWQFISSALLAILTVIAMIIKRRPKKWDELNQCIAQVIGKLPGLIITAETIKNDDGSPAGDDKKLFVVSNACNILENILKRSLSLSEEQYAYKTFSFYLEQILETPQKKGD